MSEVTDYCDKTYKRLVGLKTGLYGVITAAEKVSDQTHAEQAKQLNSMLESIENGLEALRNQCPPDWSPNKNRLWQQNILHQGPGRRHAHLLQCLRLVLVW